jgi:hypothetical protein
MEIQFIDGYKYKCLKLNIQIQKDLVICVYSYIHIRSILKSKEEDPYMYIHIDISVHKFVTSFSDSMYLNLDIIT